METAYKKRLVDERTRVRKEVVASEDKIAEASALVSYLELSDPDISSRSYGKVSKLVADNSRQVMQEYLSVRGLKRADSSDVVTPIRDKFVSRVEALIDPKQPMDLLTISQGVDVELRQTDFSQRLADRTYASDLSVPAGDYQLSVSGKENALFSKFVDHLGLDSRTVVATPRAYGDVIEEYLSELHNRRTAAIQKETARAAKAGRDPRVVEMQDLLTPAAELLIFRSVERGEPLDNVILAINAMDRNLPMLDGEQSRAFASLKSLARRVSASQMLDVR